MAEKLVGLQIGSVHIRFLQIVMPNNKSVGWSAGDDDWPGDDDRAGDDHWAGDDDWAGSMMLEAWRALHNHGRSGGPVKRFGEPLAAVVGPVKRFGEHLVVAVGPVKRFMQSFDAAHRLERMFDREALHGRVCWAHSLRRRTVLDMRRVWV